MRVNNILAQGQERTRRTRGNRQNPAEPNYNQLCLGPNEVLAIEELLFRYAQRSELAEEIELLSSGQEVPRNSSIKNLIPIWDEENQLLRHNSRIVNYKPIILPKHIGQNIYYSSTYMQYLRDYRARISSPISYLVTD